MTNWPAFAFPATRGALISIRLMAGARTSLLTILYMKALPSFTEYFYSKEDASF